MEICEMTKDIDAEISETKKKLAELRKSREEIINGNTLREEGIEFALRGWKASEWLRKHNPEEFIRKAKMVRWDWNVPEHLRRFGANIHFHRAIWETRFSIRVCKKASDGRTIFAGHLTPEELQLAKGYAKDTTDKWEAFWLATMNEQEENEFIFLNRKSRPKHSC